MPAGTENEIEHETEKWKRRAYAIWAVIGIIILCGAALWLAGILWQAVAAVVVTALISFLLHGLVDRLERFGIPRTVGAAIAVLGSIAVVVGCLAILVPSLVSQGTTLAESLPSYARMARDFVNDLPSMLSVDSSTINSAITNASSWLQSQAGTILSGAAGGVVGAAVGFGNGLLVLFIAVLCSFWVLIDLPKLKVELMKLFAPKTQATIHTIADAFGTAVYGWAKATLICAVITGVLNGVIYAIVGVPYSVLLGFLCLLMYFVPYIGPMIACVVVAIAALLVSPITAIVAIIVNVVVSNVVANFISPKLMKSSVNIHPALVMIVILIGGGLGGAIGMLFSIPIAAAIQGVFVTFFEERTGKQLATEDGALFQKPVEAKMPTLDTTGHLPKIKMR